MSRNLGYDPAGSITHIQDDAQQTIYFRNRRVEPSNDYTYDALYRLIQATGREHLGQGGAPIAHSHNDAGRVGLVSADAAGRFAPNDGNAMGTYIESYVYDAVGNFLQMQHRGSDPAHAGWTRAYDYLERSLIEDGNGGAPLKTSNRLTRTTLNPNGANPPQVEPYQHGAHGNIVRMPHLGGGLSGPNMHWDYKDQLRQTDLGGGGGSAWYVYDASGQRVRKVWEKAPGLTEERIYLGGFEIFRKHGGPIGANTATLERETLHVMDDKQRIALVETRSLDAAGNDQAPRQLIRYQFGNHLGSASLELDEQAQIISYEEYAPYGSSTYQAVRSQTEMAKRYRYTGKERDEESGLYYHGARYYAAWLGRWVSCDRIGIEDDVNGYAYVGDRPITAKDSTGLADEGVTKIGDWLQAFVDTVPEDEWKQLSATDPDWGSTTPSSRGTRYHTVMEAAVEFGWENKVGADIERVVSELHVDASGNLVAVNTPPGAANAYGTKRTADLGILKEGMTRRDIADRLKAGQTIKASDVLDITLDYKTGNASLKSKQAMVALSGVPYERLAKGGDLAGDIGGAKATPWARSRALKATLGGLVAGVVLAPLTARAASSVVPEGAQEATYETTSTVVDAGVEWVQQIGPQNALAAVTALTAAGRLGAGAIAASASAAFSATSLAGIGAAGAGAVGVAVASVAVAGAVGYGIGTLINKTLVEPLVDKLAPGSGAVGDWYYKTFLK